MERANRRVKARNAWLAHVASRFFYILLASVTVCQHPIFVARRLRSSIYRDLLDWQYEAWIPYICLRRNDQVTDAKAKGDQKQRLVYSRCLLHFIFLHSGRTP